MKRTSTSVLKRNQQIAKTATQDSIPAEWDTYALTYKCTHGLKARQKKTDPTSDESEDGEDRAPRHIRETGCTASINARVACGANGYYCENRLPKTADIVETVRNWHDSGAASLRMLLKLRKETGRAIFKNPETTFVQSVVWQSAKMRRWFSAYPEVVMVDCTHSTN